MPLEVLTHAVAAATATMLPATPPPQQQNHTGSHHPSPHRYHFDDTSFIVACLALVAICSWAFACLAMRTLLIRRDHLAFEQFDAADAARGDAVRVRTSAAAAAAATGEYRSPKSGGQRGRGESTTASSMSRVAADTVPAGGCDAATVATAATDVHSASNLLFSAPYGSLPRNSRVMGPSSLASPGIGGVSPRPRGVGMAALSPIAATRAESVSIQSDPYDRGDDPSAQLDGPLLRATPVGPADRDAGLGALQQRDRSSSRLAHDRAEHSALLMRTTPRRLRRADSVRDIAGSPAAGDRAGALTAPSVSMSNTLLAPPLLGTPAGFSAGGPPAGMASFEAAADGSMTMMTFYGDGSFGSFAPDTSWRARVLSDRHSLFYLGCISTGLSVSVVTLAIAMLDKRATFNPDGLLMSWVAVVPVLFFYGTSTLLLWLLNSWALAGQPVAVRRIPAVFLATIAFALLGAAVVACWVPPAIEVLEYISSCIAAVLSVSSVVTLFAVVPSDCVQMRVAVGVLAAALASKAVVAWPWIQGGHLPDNAYNAIWAAVMVVPLMIAFVSVHWRVAPAATGGGGAGGRSSGGAHR